MDYLILHLICFRFQRVMTQNEKIKTNSLYEEPKIGIASWANNGWHNKSYWPITKEKGS
jgi:hypothetical protein